MAGILLCLPVFAQPVLTDNIFIRIGESAPVQYAIGNFDPGPSGANISWDFSQLQDDTISYEWAAQLPAESPFTDSFPDANVAFQFPLQSSDVDNWLYYKYTDELEVLAYGGAALLTDTATANVDTFYYLLHEDPKLEIKAPFSYQEEVTDQFKGTNYVKFQGQEFVQIRTGTTTLKADAYGTLITPAGTFTNVLRVRTQEDIVDEFMNIPTEQHNVRYSWYSPDQKYLLLQMDSIAQEQFGGSSFVSTSIGYRSGTVSTAIGDELSDELKLKVFPNPTTDLVQIEFELSEPETLQISVRNIIGQNLISLPTQFASGKMQQYLNLSSISPGIYFIQIETSRGIATKRIQLSR